MPKSKSASPEASKKTRKAAIPPAPSYDEIALRAYHIYLERGSTPGDPMRDWLQAERELALAPTKSTRKATLVSIAA